MSIPAPRSSLPRFLLPALPVALAGTAPAAHAVVVNFDIADSTVSTGGTADLYFDLTTGAISPSAFGGADFYLKHINSTNGKPAIDNYSSNYNQIATSGAYVARFSDGGLVNSSAAWFSGLRFLNYNGNNQANWPADGTDGFIGLRVSSDSGANYNYGWAEVSYNADQSFTLYQFAYETDANTGITISSVAVPEPATSAVATGLAALLAGSAALYAKRRKKKSAEAIAA